jgi:predicted phosphodiesterase
MITFCKPAAPYVGKNTNLHVVASDIHFCFEHAVAVERFVDFVARTQPRVIHLLGDIIDLYPLSRFRKSPELAIKLQEEFDAHAEFLAA